MPFDMVKPSQSAEITEEVTKDMTTNRMNRPGADVLSTPSLLMLMERTAIQATDPLLPKGYVTVGYAVDGMRHMAPTALGARVRVKATVAEVDNNKFTYSIEAYEGDKRIGVATHKRAAISTTRLAATRQEAIRALRSALHHAGVRDWCMMRLIRSSLYSPFFQILTGGMRTPSWKISVAWIGIDPGTMPPMSDWCPNIEV